MDVVIVKIGEYSDQRIVGVFSSKEAAQDYIMRSTDPASGDGWDTPYIDNTYQLDDPALFEENKDKPIMYLTRFRVQHTESGNNILLGYYKNFEDKDINIKIKTHDKREFKYNPDSRYISNTGYIILEEEYPKEKLIKIIADKVYQELYNRINVTYETKED